MVRGRACQEGGKEIDKSVNSSPPTLGIDGLYDEKLGCILLYILYKTGRRAASPAFDQVLHPLLTKYSPTSYNKIVPQDISILRLNTVFFAFETKTGINAAIFGAQEKNNLIYKWFLTYKGDHLKREDGTLNTSNTIVVRLTKLLTEGYNVILNGQEQILKGDIKIYPPNVLTLDMYDGKCITQHHYEASWWDAKVGATSYKYEVLKDYFITTQAETVQTYEISNTFTQIEQEELINNLTIQLEQIKSSTCWKITKPLRRIMHLLKRY